MCWLFHLPYLIYSLPWPCEGAISTRPLGWMEYISSRSFRSILETQVFHCIQGSVNWETVFSGSLIDSDHPQIPALGIVLFGLLPITCYCLSRSSSGWPSASTGTCWKEVRVHLSFPLGLSFGFGIFSKAYILSHAPMSSPVTPTGMPEFCPVLVGVYERWLFKLETHDWIFKMWLYM